MRTVPHVVISLTVCSLGERSDTVGSKRRECALAVQGRSGSSKVDDFGTNRKRVYDFLLVGHCDYGPILHRFRDTANFLQASSATYVTRFVS